MAVDETRCDDATVGVDLLPATIVDLSNRHDPSAGYGDIGPVTLLARTVDDGAAPNHHIDHGSSSSGVTGADPAGD